MMFNLDVDLDDLNNEGLDAVLSIMFDGLKGSYTSDWALTGPLIERLGVTLTYTPPAKDSGTPQVTLRPRMGEEPEGELCWMADYGGEYEQHAKPLVAVTKALIRSKLHEHNLPLPAEAAVKYLKRQSTAVHAVLEESDCHDVEQHGDDVNTYSLTPKSDCMEEFQGVVRIVKQLSSLQIIKEHVDADRTGGVDLIVVKHSFSW